MYNLQLECTLFNSPFNTPPLKCASGSTLPTRSYQKKKKNTKKRNLSKFDEQEDAKTRT